MKHTPKGLASCAWISWLARLAFFGIAGAEPSGPVARWIFDDAGDAVNGVGTSPTPGRLLGHPKQVSGVLGQALRLGGATQGLAIPHVPALKPAAQITLSAWVLPTALGGNRTIYRKEDGGTHLSLGLKLGGRVANQQTVEHSF